MNKQQYEFGVIVLAAGESKRMGVAKPVLPWGRKKTILHVILESAYLARDYVHPVVVLGYEYDWVCGLVRTSHHYVLNKNYKKGRTTSIQKGLAALPNSIDGVYLWPVDCPMVSVSVLDALEQAFAGSDGIYIPSHEMKRGHPPLIGADYIEEIHALEADQSLRDLYDRHEQKIVHVNVDDVSVLDNINTPRDYENLLHRYGMKLL